MVENPENWKGIACPACGHHTHKVLDSRPRKDATHRRRECRNCKHKFNTVEIIGSARDANTKIKVSTIRDAIVGLAKMLRSFERDG
jgi:transcriptional regulator NrdR family protein